MKTAILLLLVLFQFQAIGQTLSRSSLNVIGFNLVSSGLTLKQSAGEISNGIIDKNGLEGYIGFIVLNEKINDPLAVTSPVIEFQVYPNPTSSTVVISFSGQFNGSIQVSDIQGRLIDNYTIKSKQIEIKNLTKELNIITIIDSNGSTLKTIKIIKN
ncbi:T9SS type A sorting domain-containing protein [Fulvivirga lutimaris]|uniref:T9SS type A sorting domain-containing protein n=1 Tax=Fulvivirga lutimaris TaxID=1819566 RepID=UPI0016272A80